jgi:hypothetical protein
MNYLSPFVLVSIAGFHDSFMNWKVLFFDKAIGARVVWRDLNVVNAILQCKMFNCSDESWTIVCYDLFNRPPSTQNIFKNKFPNSRTCLSSESSPFWSSSKSISSMHNVAIATSRQHQECVDVNFAKESWDVRYRRWNVEIANLADLASVAC